MSGPIDIFELLKADLDARNEKGRQTYGGTLRPFDGRDSHRDLYEELLDALAYERKRQVEREEALKALAVLEGGDDVCGYNTELAVIRRALGG